MAASISARPSRVPIIAAARIGGYDGTIHRSACTEVFMRGGPVGLDAHSPTRRDVLKGAGAALAATLALPVVARAQSETSRDVRQLNGLLANEYAAIQAYEACSSALALTGPDDSLASTKSVALALAAHFSGHHREHARQLATMLRAAGATPILYDDVRFTMPADYPPTVGNVLRIATNVERRASVLYTRSIGGGDSRLAAQLIASIGGVESQHFIVLSLLAQGILAPTDVTLMLANDVVPEAFVVQTAADTSGLEHVPDFDFE